MHHMHAPPKMAPLVRFGVLQYCHRVAVVRYLHRFALSCFVFYSDTLSNSLDPVGAAQFFRLEFGKSDACKNALYLHQ